MFSMKRLLPILLIQWTLIIFDMVARLICFYAILLLVGCSYEPKGVTFFVREEDDWSNSRILLVNQFDTVMIKEVVNPAKRYGFTCHNLFCKNREDMILKSDSDWEQSIRIWPCFPIRIHRISGRVDTLYCFGKHYAYTGIGYISAYGTQGNWMVLESKVPGRILGHEYLVDNKDKTRDTLSLLMAEYTYAGQERVFASRKVDYWIASRNSYDLFGPMTRKELKEQMRQLKISIPMVLDGLYDRYVRTHDSTHRVDNTPKEFYWPHHRKRKDVIIE